MTDKAERKLFKLLKDILGFKPSDLSLYKAALTHKSINEFNYAQSIENNERLEFVGDAVLSLVISDILYEKYPEIDEGSLTNFRSNIVSRKILNKTAVDIGIDELIICSGNIESDSENIYGNALEAIFSAVFYDKGYRYCKSFAQKIFFNSVNFCKDIILLDCNYKSQLIDFAQKNRIQFSFNTYENCEANETQKHFIAELFFNNKYVSSGKAWTKKEAEQSCSKNALTYKKEELLFIANN